ncbi:DUF929 family protein [Lapillicoccus jejuensis]|uniref:Uncharacterized protein DUF929 n=1 Tax=Lapillicoccus jejuensis TaxID=402171 RepID=A0A542E0L1_9MICO|nr:DUF929 family protein [Lapillicoccus jejuensis]TQJ08883.1 uncharacterized protein DUF929 [Lapillicoccus jejuensis]
MAKSARQNNAQLQKIRAEQKAAERRRSLIIAGSATVVVLAIVAAVIIFAVNAPKAPQTAAATSGTASETVVKDLTTIPASAFDTVGAGSAQGTVVKDVSGGSVVEKDGKPRLIYVGAEYCPYCASERWSLVTALSRFGTWSGLDYAVSSDTDQPASIPTLSLKDAKFTSDYLSFESYEAQDRNGKPLQAVPDDVQKIEQSTGTTGIPFVWFAGKAYQSGALYDGTVLQGLSQEKIAAQVKDPSTAISKGVLGGANLTTARLCQLTGNKPADVCTSSGVTKAAAALQSGS